MLSTTLRNQDSDTVVTIPPSVLKSLNLKVGDELQMDVRDRTLVMVLVLATKPKRYTLAQLLVGATPAAIKALNYDSAWSREGNAIGCELV
jgi:antitoxin component of MazEF toxin-antitoxin module